MKVMTMTLGNMGNNTYIVIDEKNLNCVVIDPSYEPERIIEYISANGYHLKALLITHGHFDHIGAVDMIHDHMKVPVYAHKKEAAIMTDALKNLSTYFLSKEIIATATDYIQDGDLLDFTGELVFEAIGVPGHSPMSICFHHKLTHQLFSGDTLFAGSIGRTDYYEGGSHELVHNIKERLLILHPETKVHPGHGPKTTIATEKQANPYLVDTYE